MTVKFNNIKINNWLDFINLKFADKSFYSISSDDSGYTIKSKTNKTTIWFGLSEDNLRLDDCQYYNKDCRGWSGETTAANPDLGIFNQNNVETLNKVLLTPVKNGWISIDYYLNDSFYKSETYYNKDKSSTPFVYVDSNFGCLSMILFPIFWLVGKLMDIGFVGHKKEIIVDGISSNAQ